MSYTKNEMELNEKAVSARDKGAESEKQVGKKPKQPRKGSRWTAVDTVILLMVLLAVAGVVARSFMQTPKVTPQDNATYFVEFNIKEIHQSALEGLQAGDALYLYETNALVGYIGKYENDKIAINETGAVEGKKGYVTAWGCMFCRDASYKDGALLVEGTDTYLVPGSVMLLRTDKAVFEVEITKIRT
ncbi:MAG: hypothetical protein E7645_00845 [Ruminococcaceae bacterium]|nr:hypothetical protein [Oscillospiraceae bacterium]